MPRDAFEALWNKISSNSVKFVRLVDAGEKNDGVQAGARGGGGGGCSEEGAGGGEEVVVASWHEEGCGNGGRSRGSVLAREAFYLATGGELPPAAYADVC